MQRITKRLGASLLGGVTVVSMAAGPAFAEGSFASSLTQVQPSFKSRTWTDMNRDGSNTVVALSNCKLNAGGQTPGSMPIKSVEVWLVRGSNTFVKSITHPCGVYNFGVQPAGDYHFFVAAINGFVSKERKAFLNASVKVYY